MELEHRMECQYCDFVFDPVSYRWLCPNCRQKNSCCDGAPLPPTGMHCDYERESTVVGEPSE